MGTEQTAAWCCICACSRACIRSLAENQGPNAESTYSVHFLHLLVNVLQHLQKPTVGGYSQCPVPFPSLAINRLAKSPDESPASYLHVTMFDEYGALCIRKRANHITNTLYIHIVNMQVLKVCVHVADVPGIIAPLRCSSVSCFSCMSRSAPWIIISKTVLLSYFPHMYLLLSGLSLLSMFVRGSVAGRVVERLSFVSEDSQSRKYSALNRILERVSRVCL